MKIGQIISEKRKEKGITQQELAEFVGVSKAAVSKWETGLTYPDRVRCFLLAVAAWRLRWHRCLYPRAWVCLAGSPKST